MVISVIIVTYNSDAYIKKCLESIQKFNDLYEYDLEVIVVDNTLSTSLFLRKCVSVFKFAKLYKNPVNNGFGGGNNLGASEAKGDILLFLNPDTVLIEPIFKDVINKFKDPNIGTIGCLLVNESGKRSNSYGYFPEKRDIYSSVFKKLFELNNRIYNQENIFPWGANLFVRKADFDRVGKFDSAFFLCHEEADLCTRLKPLNVCILDKKIIHYEGHSTVQHGHRFDSWLKTLIQYHHKFNYSLNKTLIQYEKIIFFSILFRIFTGQKWLSLIENFKKIRNARKG